jgi:hypothetical protein
MIVESFRSKIAPLLKMLLPKVTDNVARKAIESGST